jgi:hypothetical protein
VFARTPKVSTSIFGTPREAGFGGDVLHEGVAERNRPPDAGVEALCAEVHSGRGRKEGLGDEGPVWKRVEASTFPVKSEYGLTESGVEILDVVREIKIQASGRSRTSPAGRRTAGTASYRAQNPIQYRTVSISPPDTFPKKITYLFPLRRRVILWTILPTSPALCRPSASWRHSS